MQFRINLPCGLSSVTSPVLSLVLSSFSVWLEFTVEEIEPKYFLGSQISLLEL